MNKHYVQTHQATTPRMAAIDVRRMRERIARDCAAVLKRFCYVPANPVGACFRVNNVHFN